eukprot:m51a1_g13856 hypothetical protein (507) ;mRNA; r:583607-585350
MGEKDGAMPEPPPKRLRRLGRSELCAVRPTAEASDRVVQEVPYPELVPVEEVFAFRADGVPNVALLRKKFEREARLSEAAVTRLLEQARAVLQRESNVIRLPAPAVVFGDIHGQFYDLVAMLDSVGEGQAQAQGPLVFLGDYVDRGDFGCEAALLLLAMKVADPARVVLLRGNHETRTISRSMTFHAECTHKYGDAVFDLFMRAFDALPLAAVIEREAGDVFCVHAGIGPSVRSLDQILEIDRLHEPSKDEPVLWDMLWSDPWESDDPSLSPRSRTFTRNEYRRTSCKYGPRAVGSFLAANGLACILRAHEVKPDGYCVHFADGAGPAARGLDSATVVTLFSAPHYSEFGNAGAIMRVGQREMVPCAFASAAPHPFILHGAQTWSQDAFSWTLEKICPCVVSLLLWLMEDTKSSEPQDAAKDAELQSKVKHLMERTAAMRKQQEEYRQVLRPDYHKNMRLFTELLAKDRDLEALPESMADSSSPAPLAAVPKAARASYRNNLSISQ